MTSDGLRNPKGTSSECSLFIDNIGLQYTFAVCCAQDNGKPPILAQALASQIFHDSRVCYGDCGDSLYTSIFL